MALGASIYHINFVFSVVSLLKGEETNSDTIFGQCLKISSGRVMWRIDGVGVLKIVLKSNEY